MECSLRQRFRGLFLGAAIGAIDRRTQNAPFLDYLFWAAQDIIQRSEYLAFPKTVEVQPEAGLAKVLLGTLMHHENFPQFRASLRLQASAQAESGFNSDDFNSDDLEALELLSQLLAACLLGQTINLDYLQSQVSNATPVKILGKLQDLLQAKASLTQAQQLFCHAHSTAVDSTAIDSTAIHECVAIALYCWLSTPLAFELGLTRSQHPQHPPLTSMLTGALLGATLGANRIPLQPQACLLTPAMVSQKPETASTLQRQLLIMADQLFLQWAGISIDDPMQLPDADSILAIAAPGILKPRTECQNPLTSWY